jgi:hypothetical protein
MSALSRFDVADASRLSDPAVVRFAEACPNLIHVELQSPTKLTDTALHGLLKHCTKLEYLGFTGTGIASENLTADVLIILMRNSEMAKHLRKLVLTDQMYPDISAVAKHLSDARKALEFVLGSTCKTRGFLKGWQGGKEELVFPEPSTVDEGMAISTTLDVSMASKPSLTNSPTGGDHRDCELKPKQSGPCNVM